MEIYLTAFTLGLIGSLHCIGMCGPIAFALPLKDNNLITRIGGGTIYNSGRIFTYSLIGAIFGGIGHSVSIATGQQWISIAIGVLLIVSVFIPNNIVNKVNFSNGLFGFVSGLKARMANQLRKKTNASLLLIGVLNGFLPCGLVYAAIGGAIATASATDGLLYLAVFGIGTFPVMFLTVLFSSFIGVRVRNLFKKAKPVLLILLGTLFVLRGLNLDIPYVSPKINVEQNDTIKCH